MSDQIGAAAEKQTPDGPFDQFLLKEYDNIAAAHFNTSNTISTFFKHYLLIVSLPLPLLALLAKPLSETREAKDIREAAASRLTEAEKPPESSTTGTHRRPAGEGKFPYSALVAIAATIVALVGFCVTVYVVNLRFDALLYARTVNGLRDYFARKSALPTSELERVLVLPRSAGLPRYFEGSFFFPVVLAFALLDAAYLVGGWFWHVASAGTANDWWAWIIAAGCVCFVLHIGAYMALARHRESGYLLPLPSPCIGVDIDGVLNCHREHFTKLLARLRGKDVAPDRITEIPVRKCEGLGVTREDEHAVFNTPEYWIDMPAREGAPETLSYMRRVLGCRIAIFTHRPWPDLGLLPEDQRRELATLWANADKAWRVPGKAMRNITRRWLKENSIPYDRLVLETGSMTGPGIEDSCSDRLAAAQRGEFRVAVEDDPCKAKQLAGLCEIVLLMDHPYNQHARHSLPDNVIRVTSWQEVRRFFALASVIRTPCRSA